MARVTPESSVQVRMGVFALLRCSGVASGKQSWFARNAMISRLCLSLEAAELDHSVVAVGIIRVFMVRMVEMGFCE